MQEINNIRQAVMIAIIHRIFCRKRNITLSFYKSELMSTTGTSGVGAPNRLITTFI